MSNPTIVQVNLYHPVDDFLAGENHTDEDFCEIYDYVNDYLSNFSDKEIERDTGLSREDYEQELFDGMPMIAEFRQSAFKDALEQWAEIHDTDIDEMVRGYVSCGRGAFQMVHGYGYAWLSADVYGGSADGTARHEFDSWAEDELGIRFIFE